MFLGQKIWLP